MPDTQKSLTPGQSSAYICSRLIEFTRLIDFVKISKSAKFDYQKHSTVKHIDWLQQTREHMNVPLEGIGNLALKRAAEDSTFYEGILYSSAFTFAHSILEEILIEMHNILCYIDHGYLNETIEKMVNEKEYKLETIKKHGVDGIIRQAREEYLSNYNRRFSLSKKVERLLLKIPPTTKYKSFYNKEDLDRLDIRRQEVVHAVEPITNADEAINGIEYFMHLATGLGISFMEKYPQGVSFDWNYFKELTYNDDLIDKDCPSILGDLTIDNNTTA